MKDNKLIAEFMEFHRDTEDLYLIDNYNLRSENQFQATYVREMKFHSSWDWLMPVVEKIESLRDANGDAYRFTIDMCNAQIEGTHIEIIGGAYKLNTTYQAVVEFINQLNK